MLLKSGFGESVVPTKRASEGLWRIQSHAFSEEKDVVIGPSQDALHGMVARVSCRTGASLMTISTEIVVVTHETFVAFASKISLQTRITADTFMSRHYRIRRVPKVKEPFGARV